MVTALAAHVAWNEDRTLAHLPALLERKFGLPYAKNGGGTCLLSQVAYSVQAVTGLSARTISESLMKVLPAAGQNGWDLQQILRALRSSVRDKQHSYTIRTSVSVYNTMPAVYTAVMDGQPVILILPREACSAFEMEAYAYRDGTVDASPVRATAANLYHSLLVIGVDAAGYLILRDSRSKYAFKGYLRVSLLPLEEALAAGRIRLLSVNVYSCRPS